MSAHWKLRDADPDKEGTSEAVILASREARATAGIGAATGEWQRSYIKVTSGAITVGAVVQALQLGPGAIKLDPMLRRELKVAEGAIVEVDALSPAAAEEVRIAVPSSGVSETELKNLCRTYLSSQPLSAKQSKPLFLYSGERLSVEIVRVIPGDLCILTASTRIDITKRESVGTRISFGDIGGLDREIRMLVERILWPLRHREVFTSMGIRVPRGVLLSGPPGCGKTLLARALSGELGIPCFEIRGPEVFAGVYGESEGRVRELFAQAREKAPALVLIDEIDAIAPSRQETRGELERRIVTMLLTEMDGLHDTGGVLVVATTNEADTLDPALRRPGRFDFEVAVGAPAVEGRLQILKIHTRHMPLNAISLEAIAARTHGYNGADLMNLCREAAFDALTRSLEGRDPAEAEPTALRSARVTGDDFDSALKKLRPSALREFAVELPGSLSWDDVGGLDAVKETLVEEVVQAISNPATYETMGIRPVRGVLLYGPPGTGKTLLARIIAAQAGANFISVRGPEILSKWVGESERRLRQMFERARQVSPCIIFFDEIDALTATRGQATNEVGDRVVNQLLTEMDGFQVGKQVCVIAATNRKDIIDPALLRPGRFDYLFEVGLPKPEERRRIFEIHLKSKPVTSDLDLVELSSDGLTEGFSGAHIAEACRRAAMTALRERAFPVEGAIVEPRHLLDAVRAVRENIENLEKKISIGFGAIRDGR